MAKEKLLIYAHYYYPDVASTGQLLTELAEGLQEEFETTVICTVPSYTGKIDAKYKTDSIYEEYLNGIRVIRVKVPEFDKANKKSRLLNISAYFIRAILASMKLPKQDYIIAVSQPPILGGLLGVLGKWLKKAKYVYLIQDFNPEQTSAVNYTSQSFVLKVALFLDKFSCRQSDRVVVVGRDMLKTLNKRFKYKKVPDATFINNWTDEEAIVPLSDHHPKVKAFKKKYGLKDKVIIQYSGNLGLYYDLENILKVIKEFKGNQEVIFLFVGEGSIKEKLIDYKNEHQLNNVQFIPYQDKEELVFSLNAGDIHWVVNAKGIKGVSVPSKLYGIMAAGKPVIGVLEKGTEARLLIEESGCGIVTNPGDYEGIKELIERSLLQIKSLKVAGLKGRAYLEKNLTKAYSIKKYTDMMRELNEDAMELKEQVIKK